MTEQQKGVRFSTQ